MRIYLQAKPNGTEAPRYVHLMLQQDLLGGWLLTREWGVQGGRPSVKREVYLEREAAEGALVAVRDAQVKRGYQVMFSQGNDAPEGLRYG